MVKGGDFSMIKVWAGLEARNFIHVSIDEVSFQKSVQIFKRELTIAPQQVERCVKYDQLSPNI